MKKKKGGKYLRQEVREKGALLKTGLPLLISGFLSLSLLQTVLCQNKAPAPVQSGTANYELLDRFEMQTTNDISGALEGVLAIEKTYWLSDDDQVAPEPDQSKYGSTNDPSTLGWLLEEAAELLDGQTMHFNTGIKLTPGSKVNYYLDDSILAITWKQDIDWITYSFSEVKISHPSQFRRFLAGGEYGSSVQLTTTEMSKSVNAVVASSGDFYKFRTSGIIVYDGVLQKMNGKRYDTCFIDKNSDLQFVYAGQITEKADAEKYIADNDIRFSLGFGPVMIENGEIVDINGNYAIGEVSGKYPRAGLGQIDKLHYILVTANSETFPDIPDIYEFAEIGKMLGCDKFYNLDGGQTAVLCMNDKLINKVIYGAQRQISDIIYFATAIPEGG